MTDSQREADDRFALDQIKKHFDAGRMALARWHCRVFSGLVRGRPAGQVARMEQKQVLA